MNKKKVMLTGGGGREHALAHKISQSPLLEKLIIVPGSDRIKEYGECISLPTVPPFRELLHYLKENPVDVIVPGPEQALVDGLRDTVEKETGIPVFGPDRNSAQLEGSKVFAKKFMLEENIPTASAEFFDNYEPATVHIRSRKYPLVVKADGLAAGKGVAVCRDFPAAENALDEIMVDKRFGSAGDSVMIEDCLEGEEVSIFAVLTGETTKILTSAQDFKRVYDNDGGPNTGGMGAYSPVGWVDDELSRKINERILIPTVSGLKKRGLNYRGIIYLGLMVNERRDPYLLEYNCRWGDPETQVVLPRLDTDILEIIDKTLQGKLRDCDITWSDKKSLGVVLASKGYPTSPEDGKKIKIEANAGLNIYHAGTVHREGKWVTRGGRIFCVTCLGEDWTGLREKVYKGIEKISFEGMHYRRDIGKKPCREK